MSSQEARITVHADQVRGRISRFLTGACLEDVNHEVYGGLYSQMVFGESFQEPRSSAPVEQGEEEIEVSGMWHPVRRGDAVGTWTLEKERPFAGFQSQRLAFASGRGEIGIENRWLNRWGMNFVEDKGYEGYLWVRTEEPAEVHVALERGDGSQVYAESRLAVDVGDWRRLDFALTPSETDTKGRFAIKLKRPGSVVVGHAFLQPGEWGRFKGLPVRRDVAEALMDQGVTVLRYGGSMINHAEYRWKNMIGPRDRRPPYCGTWYPYSSNGWGILDFLDFCEAAGFLGIPAFNMDETPEDMADFVDYANGPAESEWGRLRAADGHAAPYHLRHLELGNEERIDEEYFRRFKPLAEAIWRRDQEVVLVAADHRYAKPVVDPFNLEGASRGLPTMAAHRDILELAGQHDREVWFDVHVHTNDPLKLSDFDVLPTYIKALERIGGGARHRVVVFEFNAGNHAQRRALANAAGLLAIEGLGDRVPMVTSANCLQPDGQNDNGWDQGLLFLNPSQVWLQPPGYVTQMVSRNYQPISVDLEVQSAKNALRANAKCSKDGTVLVLQVVNVSERSVTGQVHISGFSPSSPKAVTEELAAQLDAVNTSAEPDSVMPQRREWRHDLAHGRTSYSFQPYSFTILRFE